MFYPGPFYIGVYGIYDSDFTVIHRRIVAEIAHFCSVGGILSAGPFPHVAGDRDF